MKLWGIPDYSMCCNKYRISASLLCIQARHGLLTFTFSRRFYPKRLTIGEYMKRLILKRQTDTGSAPNTKSQALFKWIQASKRRRERERERWRYRIIYFYFYDLMTKALLLHKINRFIIFNRMKKNECQPWTCRFSTLITHSRACMHELMNTEIIHNICNI